MSVLEKIEFENTDCFGKQTHSLPWSLCLMSFCKLFVADSTITRYIRQTKSKSKQMKATSYQVRLGQESTLQESFFSNLFVLHAQERPQGDCRVPS